MSNIDDERIKKYLGTVEERINFAKENGCKLLECKTIDNNIKLRLENIRLKKELKKQDKMIDLMVKEFLILDSFVGDYDNYTVDKLKEYFRKKVEND